MRFFQQVYDLLMPHSGKPIPKGTDLTHIQVLSLVGSSYNVEDSKTAQELLTFLFYTGKAGEAYQQFLSAKQMRLAPIPDETYYIALQYYLTAQKVYQKCQECSTYLPEFVMYTISEKGTPQVEREAETYKPPTDQATLLPSDPSKPYDDERFGVLADVWLYTYLITETDAGHVEGDPRGA